MADSNVCNWYTTEEQQQEREVATLTTPINHTYYAWHVLQAAATSQLTADRRGIEYGGGSVKEFPRNTQS